jgi:hypothetical protein
MPSVKLPNGRILSNVGANITQLEIADRAIKQGLAKPEDFKDFAFTDQERRALTRAYGGVQATTSQPTAAQRDDQERAARRQQGDVMEEFRESIQETPEIPEVGDPTKARVPFAQPQQPPPAGEGMSELEAYSPGLRSARLSQPLDTPSPSAAPSQEPMDLRAAIAPKPLGTETTQQLPSLAQPKLLPEKERAEYNYYEKNYANLDAKGVEERKKANEASVQQFNRMRQFFDAYNTSIEKGYTDKINQANFARSQGLLDEQSYKNTIAQANEKVKKEYEKLKINADIMNDFAEKAQMDELMTARRDKEIKSQKGNTVAGLTYSITQAMGSAMAGITEFQDKIIPDPIKVMADFGLISEEQIKKYEEDKKTAISKLRIAPVEISKIKQFVTPEFIEADRQKNLLYQGLYATADMVPALAASAVGGSPAMMATFFAGSYDQMGQEMQGELWDQVPEAEKEAIRIGVSAVSAGLSTAGLRALGGKMPIVNDIFFKAARKFAPNMTAGQIRRIIDAETKSYVANMTSKLTQGYLIEGTEEMIDYTQEEAVKSIYENYKRSEFGDRADLLFNNAESFREFGDGLVDNFLVGGIVGNIISGSMTAVTSIGARQRLNDRQFEVFKKIVGDGSLQDEFEATASAALEKGKISRSDYDKAMEDLRVAKEVSNQIPDDLSVAATRKAFDLLTEKAQLKKKDPALVGDRIKAIDQELASISKQKKPTTPVGSPGSEMEWSGEQVKPKPKPPVGAPGSEMEWSGEQVTPKGTQQTPTTDAVQEPTTAQVGAQPSRTEGPREEGGGGVRPGVEGTQATQAGGAQAEVDTKEDTDAEAIAINDIASAVEDKRARGVLGVDGKVSDVVYSWDEIDADYARIKTLAERGKLTKAALVKTVWGAALAINDLDRVANRLNNNPNAVDRVHAAIDARLNKPTTQPTPAPTTETATAPQLDADRIAFADEVDDAVTNLASPSRLRSLTKKALKLGYITQADHDEVLRVQKDMGSKEDAEDAFNELQASVQSNMRKAASEAPTPSAPAPTTQPTPTAPAPTTETAATTEAIAAPKAETLKKMKDLSKAEDKESSRHEKTKKSGESAKKKMLAEDARLAEVDANFDKAVNDLEKAGKLKVRCP